MNELPSARPRRDTSARWRTPAFEVVKMDAEIGSYSEETLPTRESPDAKGLAGSRP